MGTHISKGTVLNWKALKCCINPKVIAGLVVVGAGVYAFAPQAFAAALPLLVFAICPLSMVLMMGMMMGGNKESGSSGSSGQQMAAPEGSHVESLQARVAELEHELGRDATGQSNVAGSTVPPHPG